MDQRICSVPDCEAPVPARGARGMCHKHYSRWKRHGDPLVIKAVRRAPECSVENCERPVKGRGMCSMHVQRLRKHGTTDLPTPRSRKAPCFDVSCASDHLDCHLDDCPRPAYSRGLCLGHRQQQRAGEAFRTIATKRPSGTVGTSVCESAGCERPDWKRGLCLSHYGQFSRGQELRPLKKYLPDGRPACFQRDESGRKFCGPCQSWLPESDFYRARREPDGLAYSCKSCVKSNGRRSVFRRHGITETLYAEMLERQNGVCRICEKPCPKGSLSIDHDHACCPGQTSCGRCIRGLLCRACNVGIGYLADDPKLLDAAAAYLRQHSSV